MQTIFFKNKPRLVATGTIAGPKECAGVVGKYVDKTLSDDMFGESTYEKAECKMLTYAIQRAIENAGAKEEDVDMLISGDLLNQIISASFAARDFDVPFLGVYGACSTLSESIALAAALINAGYYKKNCCGNGQSFLYGGTAIPLSFGAWKHPSPSIAMDGYGCRRRVHRGHGCHKCRFGGGMRHLWQGGGFWDNRRQ